MVPSSIVNVLFSPCVLPILISMTIEWGLRSDYTFILPSAELPLDWLSSVMLDRRHHIVRHQREAFIQPATQVQTLLLLLILLSQLRILLSSLVTSTAGSTGLFNVLCLLFILSSMSLI